MVLATGVLVANDTCMKAVMEYAPPLQVLFMRGVAAALWCFPLVLLLGHGAQIPRVFNRWILLRAAGEVFAVICFVLALPHMALADITAIYQVSPLILLAGTALIFGERIGKMRMALVGVGISGALLVAQPGATTASAYAVLGFATALGGAVRDIVARKVPRDIPVVVVALAMVLFVMVSAGIATSLFETWVPPRPQHLLLMAAAGAFLATGQFFIFIAFRYTTAPTLAPFYYAFTLWALAIGFAVFGNVPNALAIAGTVAILVSGLAVMLLDGTVPAHGANMAR